MANFIAMTDGELSDPAQSVTFGQTLDLTEEQSARLLAEGFPILTESAFQATDGSKEQAWQAHAKERR